MDEVVMNNLPKLFIVFCLTAALGAQAPEKRKDPCDNPITTVEMRACALKKYQKADTELNVAYKLLTDKVKAAGYQNEHKLVDAQRAWIRYRDTNADFEASFYDGGSIQVQIRLYALIRMTQARTKEINDIISNEFDR
jgi:uncharacterized protein YecT (DUF1311 family)